jgi:hypothetical protein
MIDVRGISLPESGFNHIKYGTRDPSQTFCNFLLSSSVYFRETFPHHKLKIDAALARGKIPVHVQAAVVGVNLGWIIFSIFLECLSGITIVYSLFLLISRVYSFFLLILYVPRVQTSPGSNK